MIHLFLALAALAGPTVVPDQVEAAGHHDAVVTVDAFGRYAVVASSEQGTEIQLVDRMDGPRERAGRAGEEDGRVDVFLDRGETKVRTRSHPLGSGMASLAVFPFAELNGPRVPLLVEEKEVVSTLGDLEQRSYWVQIPEARDVSLEATGRYLTDLRIWREGSWLVDAVPRVDVIEPVEGQPWGRCQLTTRLERGLYLVTAYGGPGRPWAEEAEVEPLHLQWGVPFLGEAGRHTMALGPSGYERFRVGRASFFQLELPEAAHATLEVRHPSDGDLFRRGGSTARMTEETVPPRVSTHAHGGGPWVVTVQGAPGQRYTLQFFTPASAMQSVSVPSSGRYWVATVHAGDPVDSIDASGAFLHRAQSTDERRLVDALAVELSGDVALERRFNLMGAASMLVQVTETGEYTMETGDGASAEAKVEPWLLSRPSGYKAPPWRPADGATWDLDRGYYIVSLRPEDRGGERQVGILDLVLRPARGRKARGQPLRAALQWSDVALKYRHSYWVYRGNQPEVAAGLVVRQLPLDPTSPLPLTLRAGEKVDVSIRVGEPGRLSATAADGSPLVLSVQGGAFRPWEDLDRGTYAVVVQGTGNPVASLAFEPERFMASTPLPPLPDGALAALPEFPVISAHAPDHLDLEREGAATWNLKVDEPGLYRVQSTGLLHTVGAMRTRVRTSLVADASGAGTGRNFLVAPYLREGDYQLTVRARGRSEGHLGVELNRAPLRAGGVLQAGLPARVSLGEGEGVVYRFSVAERGRYRIAAFGVGRTFACRLEDGDGWPLEKPGGQADMVRTLDPGEYRLVLLPEETPSRRVTLLERVEDVARFDGHGPHPLPLDTPVGHTWWEPPSEDDARAPDRWVFSLPAPVDATARASEGMHGTLWHLTPEGEVAAARLYPGKAWTGPLAMGRYRLELTSSRRNNGLDYQVSLSTTQLTAGRSRGVSAPGSVALSVGEPSLIALESFGRSDVRARLVDGEGALVARSDDRPEDWNFAIVERLLPGRYQLILEPVGERRSSTEVRMLAPAEVDEPSAPLPADRQVDLGDAVHVISLSGVGSRRLLTVAVDGVESVGASVEHQQGGRWTTVSTATGHTTRQAVRVGEDGGAWRLRLWSLDRRGNPARVRVAASVPAPSRERSLSAGIRLRPAGPDLSVGAVGLDRPGTFRVVGSVAGLHWCPRPDGACVPVEDAVASPVDASLWLVRQGRSTSARAVRVSLSTGGQSLVHVPGPGPARVDLRAVGPVVAVVDATGRQPGVGLSSRGRAVPGMDASRGRAVAVVLDPKDAAARIWPADGMGDLEAHLSVTALPPVDPVAVGWEVTGSKVAARRAVAWTLPEGRKAIRLGLDRGMVAVLTDGASQRVLWADGAPRAEQLVAEERTLVVLNPTGEAGHFAVELTPGGSAPSALTVAAPYEALAPAAGTTRLRVGASPGGTVRVRGEVDEAWLLGDDGTVQRGLDLRAVAGTLVLDHRPGLVLAWVEREGDPASRWGTAAEPPAVEVEVPGRVALAGPAAHLAFEGSRRMVHLRSAHPVVALIRRDGEPPEVRVQRDGASLDLFVPEGRRVDVVLRPVGGGMLQGHLQLAATTVGRATEGLGDEVLLTPGATRAYRFETTREARVGLGVRASSGAATAVLLDDQGQVLDQGVAMMPTLPAGSWILALHLPRDAAPVTAQPALVGIEPPDTGPPADVVETYLRAAGVLP